MMLLLLYCRDRSKRVLEPCVRDTGVGNALSMQSVRPFKRVYSPHLKVLTTLTGLQPSKVFSFIVQTP
jgi:hypothetical protein